MKKKLTNFLIFLFLTIVLTGCTNSKNLSTPASDSVKSETKKITIATSFYPMYIMALNITKDIPGVQVVNVTPSQSGCLHDYQLTPTDLKLLEGAQFFIINGAGMESFMDKVISQYPSLKVIEASKGIELIKNESDGEDNPHVWVGISGAIKQVKNITEQIVALDPANAKKYQSNAAAYTQKLETLKDLMHEKISKIKSRNIITFHEAFPYFAKEFNLNIAAVIEREPGSEPSAGELAQTIEIVKKAKVKALFAEPQYPAKAGEVIARETGAKLYILDPLVSGPMGPEAYLKIMLNNLETLEEALK